MQDAGGAWWRMDCAARSLKLMRCLQNMPAHDLGVLVALLERNGFGTGVVVGALPFDQEMR